MKETLHLLYWQFEWFKRFLRTWFHIFYRPAYRKWKKERYIKKYKLEYLKRQHNVSGDIVFNKSEEFTGQYHD